MVPWFILPLFISLILLIFFEDPITIWLFMLFNGLAGGTYAVVNNVLWAEVYGTKNIGSIRSLIMSIGIFISMKYNNDSKLLLTILLSNIIIYILIYFLFLSKKSQTEAL